MFLNHHTPMPAGPTNPATPHPHDASRAAGQSHAATILVVDDTPSAREPLARLLRLAGYETVSAGDGAEAFSAIERRVPDLVLLDLMMPRVDGLSFLKAMRGDRRFDRVPVILVTAVDTPDNLATAKRLGIQDCLLKAAFTVPELLDRIARTLKPN